MAINVTLKSKKFWAVVTGGLLFLAICWLIWYWQISIPLNKDAKEQTFIIKSGQSLEKIGENLESQDLTKNRLFFVLYAYIKGEAKNIQAGKYKLGSNMNIIEITDKIAKGDIIKDWIKITIPEGWTNDEIEKELEKLGLTIEEEQLPIDLQGYLFPDTYYFEKGLSIEKIITKITSNFNEKIKETLRKEIEKQEKTLSQILTMASLLEKEVATYQDMRIVADIFWKRVKRNYPLQSCATIAYALGENKWRYSYKDTRTKSPYNTYTNVGLPPTPINNPGLLAVEAAVYPKSTEYNFFLTDPETNNTVFSRTIEEHNANKKKYFK